MQHQTSAIIRAFFFKQISWSWNTHNCAAKKKSLFTINLDYININFTSVVRIKSTWQSGFIHTKWPGTWLEVTCSTNVFAFEQFMLNFIHLNQRKSMKQQVKSTARHVSCLWESVWTDRDRREVNCNWRTAIDRCDTVPESLLWRLVWFVWKWRTTRNNAARLI